MQYSQTSTVQKHQNKVIININQAAVMPLSRPFWQVLFRFIGQHRAKQFVFIEIYYKFEGLFFYLLVTNPLRAHSLYYGLVQPPFHISRHLSGVSAGRLQVFGFR